MTTLAEVKRWTRPLVEADTRLALIGRNLVLKPVGHFLRGVFVDRTGNQLQSRLMLHINPLFAPTNSAISFPWNRGQLPNRTDDDRFEADFLDLCRSGLAELDQLRVIDEFLKQAETITIRSFGSVPINHYPFKYAEVLAALGRFAEALSILSPALRDEEATASRILAGEEAELVRKPRSAIARGYIFQAKCRLEQVARLKPLLRLLEVHDAAGIAALLRGHEQHNAKLWEVDHLWEPTPFPFES